MQSPHKRLQTMLRVFTMAPAAMLASAFVFWGVHSLLYPFVPQELLAQSALVSAVLVLTAAILVYALFRPLSGGYLLCIWAAPFGWILYAFRGSIFGALYPSWKVGVHPVFPAISALHLLLGVLFVLRGRLSRPRTSPSPA